MSLQKKRKIEYLEDSEFVEPKKLEKSPSKVVLLNIELHGFKSYRQRELIGPFDKKFTW